VATDLGERLSTNAKSTLPALPNTMFMVVIRWVLNGSDIVLSPNQFQAAYANVRYWEELSNFINRNRHPKEPYIPSLRFKCHLKQNKLADE